MPGNSETRVLVRSLVERLIQKGLDPEGIPAFVRFMAKTIIDDSSQSAASVTELTRSHESWRVEIDDEIFQLTRACLAEISLWVPDHLADVSPGFSHVMT